MTLKNRILIITWHSEKILISSRCIIGLMASLDRKSWRVPSVCFLFLLLLQYLTGIPIAIKENTPMAWGYQNYEVSGLLKLTCYKNLTTHLLTILDLPYILVCKDKFTLQIRKLCRDSQQGEKLRFPFPVGFKILIIFFLIWIIIVLIY